jgi:hypothetical protein
MRGQQVRYMVLQKQSAHDIQAEINKECARRLGTVLAHQAEDEMASTRGCKMKMTVPLGLPNEPSDDDVIALMNVFHPAIAVSVQALGEA